MTVLTNIPNGTTGLNVRDTVNALIKGKKGSVVPYLGLVSNNLHPGGQAFGGNSINSKTPHFARTLISGPSRIRLPWFFIENTGWESGVGLVSATVAAAIEYPAGTYTPITFSGGSTTGTVAAGGVIWSDDFTPSDIPEGAMFWFHCWASTAGSNILLMNFGSTTGSKSGGITITNGQANRTLDPTFVPAGPHLYWGPDAFVSMTNRRSFMVVGDSREADLSNYFDQTLDAGVIGRSLGPHFGYVSLAVAGGGIIASDADRTKRTNTYALAAYVTDCIVQSGYNDRAGTASATDVYYQAFYTDLKAVNSKLKIGQCTLFSGSTAGVAISSLTSSTTTATAVIPQKHADQLWVGETIRIAGATPSGYNGDVVITAISGTSISYTMLAGATGLASASPTGTLSDIWQSPNPTVFQIPTTFMTNLISINDNIRRGIRTSQDYYIELADFFDYGRNLPYSKPNMLIDGVHPRPYGNGQLKASGIVLNSIPGLMS